VRGTRPSEKVGASGGALADRFVVAVRLVQAYFIFDAQSLYINRWLVISPAPCALRSTAASS
jgi:hypothetical protein